MQSAANAPRIDAVRSLADNPSPLVTMSLLMALSPSSSYRSPLAWTLLLSALLLTATVALWRAPQPSVDSAPTAAAPGHGTPLPASQVAAEDAGADPIADGANAQAPQPARAVVAHRASAGQRAEDMRRVASETDLPEFAAELEKRAQAGDADAAWALAGVLEGCASVATMAAMDARQMAEQWQNLPIFGFNEAEVANLRVMIEDSMRRCSAFPPRSAEVWRGLVTDARDCAAALGHPGAQLLQRRPRGPADSPAVVQANERARRGGVELLQEAEPMDLYRYAPYLAMHSPYGDASYLLAACTLLEGCLRDPRAYALAINQTEYLQGHGASFFELSQMSPRQRLIAQAQSEEILRLWRARQYEQILSGRPTLNGMGGG